MLANLSSPEIDLPNGMLSLYLSPLGSPSTASLKVTLVLTSLAISKPEVDFPATIGSNLVWTPPSLTDISPIYLWTAVIETSSFVLKSYLVTDGPTVWETISAPIPKFAKVLLMISVLASQDASFAVALSSPSDLSSKSMLGKM